MSEPSKQRARALAPIEDVCRALTDAGALRTWLAEHAEVELPHRYEFWGRFTPDGEAPHQRLLHVDDHTLRFSWLVDGTDVTVEIGLEAEGRDSTIVTVSQTGLPSWEEMVAGDGTLSLMYTYWALSIANLIDYVEGRDLTPRCDFTSPRMREQLLIGASPQDVYDSLVDPATYARWFGAKIEVEPYVGGRWSMGGFENDLTPAKIVELEPGRKMSLAWEGMVSTWELEGSGGKTRLTFVQSGFDERRPPYGAWMGSLAGFAELRRFHELSNWRPVWLQVQLDGMPEGLLTIE